MGSNRALAVFAALAFTAPLPASAETSGRIYVYAQRLTAARSWLPISCGGAVVAELKRGMAFAIDVPPGRHTLGTESGVPAFLDVHPGDESFIRLDWTFEGGRPAVPVLNVVRADQARKEMKDLSYIKTSKVHSSSVLKTDPREPARLQFKTRDD